LKQLCQATSVKVFKSTKVIAKSSASLQTRAFKQTRNAGNSMYNNGSLPLRTLANTACCLFDIPYGAKLAFASLSKLLSFPWHTARVATSLGTTVGVLNVILINAFGCVEGTQNIRVR